MGLLTKLFRPQPTPGPLVAPASSAASADDLMQATMLAGFWAAHAVWLRQSLDGLHPFVAIQHATGEEKSVHFAGEGNENPLADAQPFFDQNKANAARAVLVFDGMLTLASGKTDAIMVVLKEYAHPDASSTWAVPYLPPDAPGGFAAQHPRLCADIDIEKAKVLAAAFRQGMAKHAQGIRDKNV